MSTNDLSAAVKALERIGKVLGALFASNMGENTDQKDKVTRLSRCGFSNSEIGDMLGLTGNAVNVALHRARHRRTKSPATKKRKKVRK